jgi:hypothetical protein
MPTIDEMIARQQERLALRPEPKPEPVVVPPPKPAEIDPFQDVEAVERLATELEKLLDNGAPSVQLTRRAAVLCGFALRVVAEMQKRRMEDTTNE